MAQCTGGTLYDFQWEQKHDFALQILRRAADRCVAGSDAAEAIEEALPFILYTFGDRFFELHRNPEKWTRRFAEDIGTELQRLKPSLETSEAGDVAQELRAEAKSAAEQWSLGDPEKPATTDVLNVIEHILFRHRITRNPAKQSTPTSLRI